MGLVDVVRSSRTRPASRTAHSHVRRISAPGRHMTRPPRRLHPPGGMTDWLGVDVSQATPACARPTSKYPDGRTGTVAGHSAHQRLGERPCPSCREAFAARVRELTARRREEGRGKVSGPSALACAEATSRHPEGRTGTVAGYSAHWKAGEAACQPCVAAWSAKTATRKASLSPDRLSRERSRVAAKARLRNKATNACLAASPEHPAGRRGTAAGYAAHIAAEQNPCRECLDASYSHWSACTRPTLRYPNGRKGTKSGYHAHVYAQEPACEACLKGSAEARARAKMDDPDLALRDKLWSKFRITLEEYEAMFAAQGYRCAICRVDTPTDIRTSRFHVDHDHACCPGPKSCGKCVRGLLCHACNTALGNFQDDPKRLKAALVYLGDGKPSSDRQGRRRHRYQKLMPIGDGAG